MTNDANTTRKLFREGKAAQRMVAVVLYHPEKRGKVYRLSTEKDIQAYEEAKMYLEEKRAKLMEEWGIDPLNTWGDLFNDRQKLALIAFVEKVRQAYERMLGEGYEEEYAKAVVTYLGLRLDLFATYLNTLVRWRGDALSFERSFDRQTLQMLWDYGEVNPFSGRRGSWNTEKMELSIEHCSMTSETSAVVLQASATSLPFPDNYFDAIFTDPPYYDNVPYSYLSDFFYVWLKRTVGDFYPELFITPLTPKSKELVAYTHDKDWDAAKRYFEEGMKKALQEIYRVLKPNGILVLVYARLRAKESAALASSIYIVARKIKKQGIGWFDEVKREMKKKLEEKLDTLWKEGISGPDFFISAIGSAIEVFGKHEKVLDYEGNEIRGDRLLQLVRDIVSDYAIRQVLHEDISSELSPLTKLYVLWRWTYGEAKAHFDEARKLATSVGLDLEKEWNRGFIKKEKEYIHVLGPHERKFKEVKDSDLIDVLHKALLLWQANKRREMVGLLVETGWGEKDVFYKVAQAISEVLPNDSKEKKLLEGFLAGKGNILRAIENGDYSMFVENGERKMQVTLEEFIEN